MTFELPRIMVCVDFSSASDRAVAEARQLAQRMGAQLDFVHVVPLAPTAGELPRLAPDSRSIEEARGALHALEESVRAEGLVAKAHIGVGNTVFGILDFIGRLHPVLVVAGSHGRGAVMRLLVGSVAESLIRRSPVPVLVVPAHGRVVPSDGREWSCRACGHVLAGSESTSRCAECGANPPQWIAANPASRDGHVEARGR